VATFLWRHLHYEGHDICRLFRRPAGWVLEGCAVFTDGSRPSQLLYTIATDRQWRSRHAFVEGYIGRRRVHARIAAGRGSRWRLSSRRQTQVDGCVDLDLAFTPATNVIALRRLGLAVGAQGESRAAYLEFPSMRMSLLEQTYRRIGAREFDYAAPRFGYRGRLVVDRHGAAQIYPGLFERETRQK